MTHHNQTKELTTWFLRINMLLIMHHIALFTPCIALFNCGRLFYIRVDHMELKTENQLEQVQWVFADPQVSSCEDTNIA
jgi:hypothetical protein